MSGQARLGRALFRLTISATTLAFCVLMAWAGRAGAEEFDKYKLESVSASLSTVQAGAHADFTTSFTLSENVSEGRPYGLTRDVVVDLPPGVIGNPQSFQRCSLAQLGEELDRTECPQDSQVGVTEVRLAGAINGTLIEPVYNMDSPGGEVVARLGFYAGGYPALINVRVDPHDYSLTAALEGAAAAAEVISARTTLWGVPASPSHDELRLTPVEAGHGELPPGGRQSGQSETPFLSNPTDCTLQRQLSITAVSYQLPGKPSTLSTPFPQIGGCGKLAFNPKFSLTPTNPEAFAPTGIDAVLQIPQDETPKGLATSTLRSAVVTLPQGMTINPAAGDGLAACSSEQVGFGTTNASDCPDAAKIGSAELEVPALERTLNGSIYQRTPEPGHLFRFWLVTDEEGVHLKLPAEIQANLSTGRLTTVFNGIPSLGGNPQLPFSELRLHVFGGPRAPLATPGCGTYQTHYEFNPWSGRPSSVGDAPMRISSGCGKGGFNPRLEAGSVGLRAGAFSPFTMTLTRQDGEADPETLSLHLPQGLLAKLAGVALCPEAATATAACPASSKVGSVAAAAGVGGAPLWIPQPGKDPTAIFLAGPYKGAPYSLVVRVPAQAGPFDLGTVVTRAGIFVDPDDATATVKTDPLPQILEGVPIAYRAVHVDIDRPEFTVNPTSCRAKRIVATVTASSGAVAKPSADYQATNCAKLSYAPRLRLALKGSMRRTGHPALRGTLTQPKGQANTAKATVLLPSSEFIDQAHINSPCTRVQFREDRCPPLSILGHATATTPLLDHPLKGNVYFRSNGGERELPDIVADLNGQIHVILVGFVDSVPVKGTDRARLRTRFVSVPDAPVSKFTLRLSGGKHGLLENSRNLCKTDRRARVSFTAQNGSTLNSDRRIDTSCKA